MSDVPSMAKTDGDVWEVFMQKKSGQPYTHVGSVHAFDAEAAIISARDLYARRPPCNGMWVVPAKEIAATAPADRDLMFDPSESKPYRHPQFYSA